MKLGNDIINYSSRVCFEKTFWDLYSVPSQIGVLIKLILMNLEKLFSLIL